jgi:hypothetical protein
MARSTSGLAVKLVGGLVLLGVALYLITLLIRLVQALAVFAVLLLVGYLVFKLAAALLWGEESTNESWEEMLDYESASDSETADDGGWRDLLPGGSEDTDDSVPASEADRLQQQYVDGEISEDEFERQLQVAMATDDEDQEDAEAESEEATAEQEYS